MKEMNELQNQLDTIFRAYDVRGVYGEELTERSAEVIGKAFGRFLKQKHDKEGIRIAVGRDARSSSPQLSSSLKEAISSEGIDIFDIGLSTSPMFYFAVQELDCEGGLCVTASHNPKEYNGLKFVGENARSISQNSGLEEIKNIALSSAAEPSTSQGEIEEVDVLDRYLDSVLEKVSLNSTSDLTVVVDTGNAVPGFVIEELKQQVPFEIIHLFPELNGDFPNHSPDPVESKNIESLKEKVVDANADLGIAFDGDGDRIVFVDEKGDVVSSDFISCLVAEEVLSDNPDETIVYTVISSNVIRDAVQKAGGESVPSRVGRAFVPEKMREVDAIFGGEYSGHFFLRRNNFSEAPFFVMFQVLSTISQNKNPFSDIILEYDNYAYSGVINFEIANKQEKLNKIEEKYQEGEVTKIDGVRVNFKDWWFIARPSNTEDLVRVAVEADNQQLMQEKINEIKDTLQVS